MSQRDQMRAELARRLDYQSHPGVAFGSGDAMPIDGDWERRQSTRAAGVVSDVITPLLQAGVSGAFAAGLAHVASDEAPLLPVGLVVAAGVWAYLLTDHVRQLWQIERWLGRDLNSDNVVGPPEPERVVRVEVKSQNRMRWVDLPIGDKQLAEVARAVLVLRKPFSRRGLAEELSQDQYRQLAGVMVGAGLLVETANNKRELSAAGRQLLRQMLEAERGGI